MMLCASETRSIDITCISVSSVATRWSTTLAISSRSAASAASRRRRRRDASGSPSRCRAASRSGRSETVQACGVRTLQLLHLVGLEPGRAPAQVRRHRPTGRPPGRSARSAATPGGRCRAAPSFCASDRRTRSGETSSSSYLSTRMVSSSSQTWSRASLCGMPARRLEGLGPVGGAEPEVGPRGLDLHALGRGLLVEPHRRLDRRHHLRRRLQPRHLGVGLDRAPRLPPGTRSRSVQVCTPSSPRLGSTSATYAR